jgi:hypothetical protein
MAFVSGPPKGCLDPSCASPRIVLVRERWDAIDKVFAGEVRCQACGGGSLYSRRDPQPRPKGPTMFQPDTALYLKKIKTGVETLDQETRKLLILEFEAQPFTREMADELGITFELFEGSTGNPNDLLVDAKLKINVPLQRMSFKMAPDATGGRVVIPDVSIKNTIKVRSDKEGPVLAARITATLRYPTADDLLYIMNGVCEQHWITFEEQQASLPMGDSDQRPRRGRKPKANGAADEANA